MSPATPFATSAVADLEAGQGVLEAGLGVLEAGLGVLEAGLGVLEDGLSVLEARLSQEQLPKQFPDDPNRFQQLPDDSRSS